MHGIILVVDNESVIRTRLKGYFEKEGYKVLEAENGAEMWYQFQHHPIDLVILDVNLPDSDGLSLARELRSQSNVGIILVTGRNESIDKIIGLEMGADDYINKPFELREFLVRVKNLLWRISLVKQAEIDTIKKMKESDDQIIFDNYILELSSRQLKRDNIVIKLTNAEFDLLAAFVSHPQQIISRQRLMQLTSHRDEGVNDRTIDVIIRRLRNKLASNLFMTIHGEGYFFSAKVNN